MIDSGPGHGSESFYSLAFHRMYALCEIATRIANSKDPVATAEHERRIFAAMRHTNEDMREAIEIGMLLREVVQS